MAYCLSSGKIEKCELVNECTIKMYSGEYKDEELYIKGKVDAGGILSEDYLCKREDKIIINTIHKLKENGYDNSEITAELVMNEIKETCGLSIDDKG